MKNKEIGCDSWLFLIDPLLLLGQTPLAVLSFVRLTGGLKQIDPSPKEFLSEPFGEKVSFEVINSWVLSHHQYPLLLRFDPSFFSVWERVRAGHLGHVQMIKVESRLIRQWNRQSIQWVQYIKHMQAINEHTDKQMNKWENWWHH